MGLLTIDGLGEVESASPAAAINTLSGPLKLRSNGLGGLEILRGRIVIDPHNNLTVVQGDLSVDQGRIFANESIRGGVTIRAGQTQIRVEEH